MSDLSAGEGPRTKHLPRRFFAGVALVLLLSIAALFVWNAVDRTDPLRALPARFDAYASTGSVSATLERLARLRAFDELLSDPSLSAFRGALLGLRSNSFLASKAFRVLANRPARVVALEGSFLAAVDLGPLGAVARLLPVAGPWLASKGFDYRYADGISTVSIGAPHQGVELALRGRLLLASTSPRLIDQAIERSSGVRPLATGSAGPLDLAQRARAEGLGLDPPAPGVIRILVDGGNLASRLSAGDAVSFPLRAGISFPKDCLVDLDVSNDRLAIDALLPVTSADAGLATILDRRSSVPAILSLLPSSTEYLSAISTSSLRDLYSAASTFLGPGGEAAYARAENACRSALGKGFDELLYSWAGGELGAFGLSGSDEPVFFVRVADESARRAAFEALFASAVLDSNTKTVVDGMRIPRIEIPWYVKDLLALVGADVPEPYWIVSGGFLFVSSSAENLRLVAGTASSGDSLPRSQAYRTLMAGTGADALALVYYSLDRSLPFFLRGSGPLESALRLYGKGVLLVRSEGGGRLGVSLRAVSGQPAAAVSELPGFPIAAGGRLAGPPLAVGTGGETTLLFPLRGGRIVARPLGVGETIDQSLDAEAQLVSTPGEKTGSTEVWALTRSGTVYRFGPRLDESAPFPLATGYRPSSPPAALPPDREGRGGIAFGVREGGYVAIAADGSLRHVELPGEPPLLAPPAFAEGWTALYAKSFDGRLHLLDAQGKEAAGWPVQIEGIGYGSPFFVRAAQGLAVGFLTQAGKLVLCALDGTELPGFPLSLDGVFYHAPVATAGHIYALSSSGTIFHVSPEGGLIGRSSSPDLATESSFLVSLALGKGGARYLFGLGSGNALYGFSLGLESLPGFPVSGALGPVAADLDGDGAAEMLVGGLDDMVHAYSFR